MSLTVVVAVRLHIPQHLADLVTSHAEAPLAGRTGSRQRRCSGSFLHLTLEQTPSGANCGFVFCDESASQSTTSDWCFDSGRLQPDVKPREGVDLLR